MGVDRSVYIGRNVMATFEENSVRLEHKHGPTIHIDTGSIDILWRALDNIRIERAQARANAVPLTTHWWDLFRARLG